MKRREFITLLGGAAVALPRAAGAQQPRKMRRIGVLWHGANEEEEAIYLAALRQGLLDFGYVEGRNIVLEMRFPDEQYERFFVLQPNLPSKTWMYWFRPGRDRCRRLPSCNNNDPNCIRQCPRSGRTKVSGQP